MDANGTTFQLLLGYSDWGACTGVEPLPDAPAPPLRKSWEGSPPGDASDLAWGAERSELTLRPHLLRSPPIPRRVPLTPAARRGAARDRYGNWYWIGDDGGEILVNSEGSGNTAHFWSAGDGLACEDEPRFGEFRPREARPPAVALPLSGLAVTEHHYLVVGVLHAGLLVFDLHAGGPPDQVFWPSGVSFAPFDMAPSPGGGVWILDRVNARYWALDCHLRVIGRQQPEKTLTAARDDDFQPRDGPRSRRTPALVFPLGIDLEAASPVAARDPIAVEGLPDGTVLILDRNPGGSSSLVYRYRFAQQLGNPVPTVVGDDLIEGAPPGGLPLAAHDFAFVPEHQAADGSTLLDRLFVVPADGDQAFDFLASRAGDQLVLQPLAEYLPMRLFGGKGLVAAGGQPYYDFADRWVPLALQRKPRHAEAADLYTPANVPSPGSPLDAGDDRRPPFDGREPGCVWHRLLIDACIPPETSVGVWSRAADDPRDLVRGQWQQEPSLYHRGDGSEQPFVPRRTGTGDGTWELLFQRARGRYLQLRLHLAGNGRSTPRLRALRAYYPRFSYLDRYLPAAYRADAASASFLDRFLANPEGTLTALEDKVAAMQMLFDPRSVPADLLGWLASWFGVALDQAWDERKRRLFLGNAMTFFQYRGTIKGLQMALHLAHDPCAEGAIFKDPPPGQPRRPQPFRIVEAFRSRQKPGLASVDPVPGLTSVNPRWRPDQGAPALHALYIASLAAATGVAPGPADGFPLAPPAGKEAAWTRFAQAVLGFVPATGPAVVGPWQDFLARRYHRIAALNAAYGTSYATFDTVPLPDRLPTGGAALVDWYEFQAIVPAMGWTAHRFTVLLPAPRQPDPDGAEHRRRLELTWRVIQREKPAHATFDIKFYWAYFRVGDVILGDDSVIDQGSRAPELLPPAVLGQSYLAGSYVAPGHPQDVPDRQVVGRDRLGR